MAFPDVPDVPAVSGVPALPGAAFAAASINLLIADVAEALGFFTLPQWGLFLDGSPVITADNVVMFAFNEQWEAPDYPVEDGLFETFNKVQRPYEVIMRFSKGGSIAERSAFLEEFAAIIGSTDLFDAVTPEKIFPDVNPLNYNLRRTHFRGVGLIEVDLKLKLVRSAASTSFSSTAPGSQQTTTDITVRPGGSSQSFAQINQPQSPSAAAVSNVGTVQPTATTDDRFSLSQALP